MEPASALVRSGMVRTRAAHRPAPSLFVYPGLRAAPWWSLRDLPPPTADAVAALWAQRSALLAEYDALARRAPSDYALAPGESKLHSGSWTWHTAVSKGAVQPTFALAAPATSGGLARIPDLLTGLPFAYAFFSSLAGGASIAPHFGPANVRLRVHLPLRVPSEDPAQCGITVGGETRAWSEPLVFDDAYEHATWNRTGAERVVLLLDLWHPDLSAGERQGLVDMFQQAKRAGWLSAGG